MAVKSGPRHAVREVEGGAFQMTVLSAQRADAGVYTCKIINEYGTKQCEGRLEVRGERLLSGLRVQGSAGGRLTAHAGHGSTLFFKT